MGSIESNLAKLESAARGPIPSGAHLVSVKIEGLQEAKETLKKLSYAIRRRVVLAAVRAANAVIVSSARREAPYLRGALSKSIRGRAKLNRNTGTVEGLVRFKSSKSQKKKGIDAYYGHMVIGGTKPHPIPDPTARKAKRVKVELYKRKYVAFGGKVYSRVSHPGSKPNSFMERVGANHSRAAVEAFEKKLGEQVEIEIQKAKAV